MQDVLTLLGVSVLGVQHCENFTKQVGKKTKIWNRYNQVPHLTQDTIWEGCKAIRRHHIQESQEVSPFQAADHKAARNRLDSMTKTNTKHK